MASCDVPDLVFSAASSASSHGADDPVTPGAAPRRANKLRKPRGSSPFSFVVDSPPAFSHFPYTFNTPASPTSTLRYASTITSSTPLVRHENAPKRTASMPSRKLTKQKPTSISYGHLPVNQDAPHNSGKRRAFSFRRRKSDRAADPPPLPIRRATFTIGTADSDDEDAQTSEQQHLQEEDRSHDDDHQSFPHHESPTPLSPRPALTRHTDMSETRLRQRQSDFDENELKRRRRWTLMTDEDITDNDFAETVLTRTQCTSWDGHQYEEYAYDDLGLLRSPTMDFSHVQRSTLLALLTTRDVLRTERHYLSHLRILVHGTLSSGQWPDHPSPFMMHDRLSSLIAISQSLLDGMEADPSVNGLAELFVRLEDDISDALSNWCAVVGGWFDVERRRKLSRNRKSMSKTLAAQFPPSRPPSPLRASTEPVLTATSPPLVPLRSKSVWRKSLPSLPHLTSMSPARHSSDSPQHHHHTIQELGILPVQRVTRYVLFFRDLLNHTDLGSPSRGIVEDAVGAATRIAKRCDEAQGHKRFLRL